MLGTTVHSDHNSACKAARQYKKQTKEKNKQANRNASLIYITIIYFR